MGHYLCPRCGSADSYLGNTLVSRKGTSLTAELGNSGIFATSSTGGTEAIQVIKCRNCSEILTAANYIKSEAELKDEASASNASRPNMWWTWGVAVIGLLVIILLTT